MELATATGTASIALVALAAASIIWPAIKPAIYKKAIKAIDANNHLKAGAIALIPFAIWTGDLYAGALLWTAGITVISVGFMELKRAMVVELQVIKKEQKASIRLAADRKIARRTFAM